ncbi:MAG: NAD-dependent epimerase/dehydratase family protein, partial [Burkholderiales bacterium]
MRVVITGAAGFLGSRLARAILERGTLRDSRGDKRSVRELVLVDVAAPARHEDPRIRVVQGNLDDRAVVDALVSPATDTIFHLAAVVSGQAEADFDIGMRVNVDATRNLLERCRACAVPPKFV